MLLEFATGLERDIFIIFGASVTENALVEMTTAARTSMELQANTLSVCSCLKCLCQLYPIWGFFSAAWIIFLNFFAFTLDSRLSKFFRKKKV